MTLLVRAVRRWWGGSRLDPKKPHAFRAIDDVAAMGATSELSTMSGTQAPVLAIAADAIRGRCRLPGCGRAADDPIHA